MSILVMADLHAHKHSQFDSYDGKGSRRLQDCLDALDWAIQSARLAGVGAFIIAGDIFHVRNKHDLEVVLPVVERIRAIAEDTQTILLAGNHDQLNYETTSLGLFGGDVRCVTKPTRIVIQGRPFDFYPYREHRHEWQAMIQDHTSSFKQEPCYAVAHVAINGAKLGTLEYVPTHGCEASDFKMYAKVFAGHYHRPQEIENIVYVGSPLQLDRSDIGQDKGVVLYDGSEVHRLVQDITPKFIHVDTRSTHTTYGGAVPGNFIDVFCDAATDAREVVEKYLGWGARGVQVHKDRAASVRTPDHVAVSIAAMNPAEAITAYAEQHKRNNPKSIERLSKLGQRLFQGGQK